jgi:hypothetical protein
MGWGPEAPGGESGVLATPTTPWTGKLRRALLQARCARAILERFQRLPPALKGTTWSIVAPHLLTGLTPGSIGSPQR